MQLRILLRKEKIAVKKIPPPGPELGGSLGRESGGLIAQLVSTPNNRKARGLSPRGTTCDLLPAEAWCLAPGSRPLLLLEEELLGWEARQVRGSHSSVG